jgi:pyruvyltransferase
MNQTFRKLSHSILYACYDIFLDSEQYLPLCYLRKNFGDTLSPLLIEGLSGKKVFRVNPVFYKKPHLMAVGSILERARSFSMIWGSGLISKDAMCIEKPKHIYAVRGPDTRKRLLENNIDCPEVYGDPALLIPRVYSPPIKKKYRLGIIPHFVDQDSSWLKTLNDPDILIIDVLQKSPLRFIDELLSCERIAASSLHGLIVADAYGIPSVWLKFSDDISGGSFKFIDYFKSVGRKDREPLTVLSETTVTAIEDQFYDYKTDIDLDALFNAFPYKS